MKPQLVPRSPLSQVVFVHDYLQLVFEDDCFSVFNRCALLISANELVRDAPGFADALVNLIGERVVSCETEPALKLRFESGAQFEVRMGDADVAGPEAYAYTRAGGVAAIAQNGA